MANLPAQQAQYVKYAEKDKHGIEIAGLGDVVEMNSARTEMTIGTNLVVDGSIETEDTATVGNLNVTGTANIGTLEFTNASIDGNMSVGGNLAVTGGITGGSIVENMNGYSFTSDPSNSEYGINNVYASAVKNGNKLTLVIAGNINYSTMIADPYLGHFTLPGNIANLLTPVISTTLDVKPVLLVTGTSASYDKKCIVSKYGNDIRFRLIGMDTEISAGVDYGFRVEATYLLSDSLIS